MSSAKFGIILAALIMITIIYFSYNYYWIISPNYTIETQNTDDIERNACGKTAIYPTNSLILQPNNILPHDTNFSGIPSLHPYYNSSSPIEIYSDDDFLDLDIEGSGNLTDPYIIEAFNITLFIGDLIHISDTAAHVIIRSNLLNGLNHTNGNGINLINTTNIIIENNFILNKTNGISIITSVNVTISRNYIAYNDGDGILIESSEGINSTDNVIRNNIVGIRSYNNQFSDKNTLSNHWIENNTIVNNSQFGIIIDNSTHSHIVDNKIESNSWVGIEVRNSQKIFIRDNLLNGVNHTYGNGIDLINTANIIIENNFILNNTNGINIITSVNVTISRNPIAYNDGEGISILSSVGINSAFNVIRNNNVGIGSYNYYSNENSLSKHLIENNIIANNSQFGIIIHNSPQSQIVDNQIESNGWVGIQIVSSHKNFIRENQIIDHDNGIETHQSNYTQIVANNILRSRTSIYQYDSHHTSIQNNYFHGEGILLDLTSHLFIYNNTMEEGINAIKLLHDSELNVDSPEELNVNITIVNNQILGMNFGIRLAGVISSLIANNILDTGNTGIQLSNIYHGSVRCNSISNYSSNGISIRSTNVTIVGNQIANNTVGLTSDNNANDNNIEWNNFITNEFFQALDYGFDNIFINNYWSDKRGPDLDKNGIVDEKYSVIGSSNNKDSYPLTDYINIPQICTQNDIGYAYPSLQDLIEQYIKKYPAIPFLSIITLFFGVNEIRKSIMKKFVSKKDEETALFPIYKYYE
ncbi:MAG: right-handed parallel beta-helix repeat-containing protein [Candidatus Kariarchaeaceae archaeon]